MERYNYVTDLSVLVPMTLSDLERRYSKDLMFTANLRVAVHVE